MELEKNVSNKFIEDALRTKSDGFYGDTVSKFEFIKSLLMLINAGNDLDAFKKHLFYNKQSPLTELSNSVFEVTCEDIHDKNSIDIIHGILGVATESGELVEALFKSITKDENGNINQIDKVNLKEEIGDIFWYLAILANDIGFTFEEIQDTVIAKLKARYPDKFTTENAVNRNLIEERKILEL